MSEKRLASRVKANSNEQFRFIKVQSTLCMAAGRLNYRKASYASNLEEKANELMRYVGRPTPVNQLRGAI